MRNRHNRASGGKNRRTLLGSGVSDKNGVAQIESPAEVHGNGAA